MFPSFGSSDPLNWLAADPSIPDIPIETDVPQVYTPPPQELPPMEVMAPEPMGPPEPWWLESQEPWGREPEPIEFVDPNEYKDWNPDEFVGPPEPPTLEDKIVKAAKQFGDTAKRRSRGVGGILSPPSAGGGASAPLGAGPKAIPPKYILPLLEMMASIGKNQ